MSLLFEGAGYPRPSMLASMSICSSAYHAVHMDSIEACADGPVIMQANECHIPCGHEDGLLCDEEWFLKGNSLLRCGDNLISRRVTMKEPVFLSNVPHQKHRLADVRLRALQESATFCRHYWLISSHRCHP